MIDTVSTQEAHYVDGCWRSGSGEHVVMIVGSCRVLPYINYFVRLNKDNRFTVVLVYVVNLAQVLDKHETNPVLLDMIRRCKWFIHEYVANYGFLNTTKESPKNLYQFGMNPELDILIPSWNDVMVLEHDYTAYGAPTPDDYIDRGEAGIDKFCSLCGLSSFPEMAERFRDNWRKVRYFWRPNHTSAEFTMYIFRLMNEKFLHLDLDGEFWQAAAKEDLFKEPHTHVTQRDIAGYGLQWS